MSIALTLLLLSFQSSDPKAASESQAASALDDRIARLALELSSESVETRERAERELLAIGKPVLAQMKKLAQLGKDPEMRARAAEIARKLEFALRPKVVARFVFGKKGTGVGDDGMGVDWIYKDAAFQGYLPVTAIGPLEWLEVSDNRKTLYPDTPSTKPGGIYVWSQIVEQTQDKAIIEITCSVKSWKSGKFTLDQKDSHVLIRLSNQSPVEDLFLALEFKSNSPAKAKEGKNQQK
jgi:hypothetical protein